MTDDELAKKHKSLSALFQTEPHKEARPNTQTEKYA